MEVLTVLLLGILLLAVLYQLWRLVNKTEKIHITPQDTSKIQSLKDLPGIPLWGLFILWWRSSTFFKYLGSIDRACQVKFWNGRAMFINDYKLGRELFKNPIFCGKRVSATFDIYSHGPHGIINAHGKEWKKQLLFCKQQLKEFGFGTRSMETMIQGEIDDVLQSWRDRDGERFSPNKSFYLPVLSALWIILSGERATAQEKTLLPLLQRVYHGLKKVFDFPCFIILSSKLSVDLTLRVARRIPIFFELLRFFNGVEDLRTLFQAKIDARKSAVRTSGAPTNLVDAYLKEAEQATDPNSGFYGNEGNLNLLAIMTDFFLAGGDTTANQLAWSMLHLIRNRDVQQRIRQEIHRVVGPDRLPSIQDRLNCPYTEAFIYEALRFTPIAAVTLPHATTEDASIGPYFVQKETVVYLNIYNIHHDPKIWGDPQNFRPERFLSEDGRTMMRHETMCAFSFGQRRCPGEYLARDSLFLYISAICQQFILSPDPLLKGIPPLQEDGSALQTPGQYYMVATPYTDSDQEENVINLVDISK